MFVSTHLISEFEGLIDEFTIIDRGKDVLTLEADAARERYQKIHVRFAGRRRHASTSPGARVLRTRGRDMELVVNGNAADVLQALRARSPETLSDRGADARGDLRLDAAAAGSGRMTAAAAVLPPGWSRRKSGRSSRPTPRRSSRSWRRASATATRSIAIGLLAFAFGSVALGAQSFGHEYSHRTLGLLLSQPIDRRRLFLYKLAVLFVMLLTLTAVTLLMFRDVLRLAASPAHRPRPCSSSLPRAASSWRRG